MPASRYHRGRWLVPALLLPGLALADDATLEIRLDAERDDLSETLVSLHATDTAVTGDEADLHRINQVNRAFSPRAIAIEHGDKVRFQNDDDVRHHVYSFSSAKRFELPLYEGQPPEDIRFDQPGMVVLGCNIHDWMVGWVHVMDTPWFDFANPDGHVSFTLPAGNYELRIWHPELDANGSRLTREISVPEGGGERHIRLPLTEQTDDDGLNRRRDGFRD